ncbi:MAG: dihydrodipicolinate synthase family protein [Rubellimicrobium sp.]|nr:dihydrodipicolinate synthase family protein [Rubellimicrobium sp.]
MPSLPHGIVPILLTPFHADGRIDHDSLHALIDFNINAGVSGLGVAIGSEIFKLGEGERLALIQSVTGHVAGRVPVIINSSAQGTDLALALSQSAEAAGADALMIFPPHFLPVSADEIEGHYRAIDTAVGIPIILQDIPQAPISPALALRIAASCPNVRGIKVETLPVATKVSEMAAAIGDALVIYGGAGGTYFIEELRRGALGTMPFCSQPAAFVKVWTLFNEGRADAARAVFEAEIAPVNKLGAQAGDLFFHLHKRLLVARGILSGATVRQPTMPLDPLTEAEIDEVIALLLRREAGS